MSEKPLPNGGDDVPLHPGSSIMVGNCRRCGRLGELNDRKTCIFDSTCTAVSSLDGGEVRVRVFAAAEALADAIARDERTDEEQEEICRAVEAWRVMAKARCPRCAGRGVDPEHDGPCGQCSTQDQTKSGGSPK